MGVPSASVDILSVHSLGLDALEAQSNVSFVSSSLLVVSALVCHVLSSTVVLTSLSVVTSVGSLPVCGSVPHFSVISVTSLVAVHPRVVIHDVVRLLGVHLDGLLDLCVVVACVLVSIE